MRLIIGKILKKMKKMIKMDNIHISPVDYGDVDENDGCKEY